MKERPILFSAPMVRALLAGTKTQTRRLVAEPHRSSRYGQLGDRLWVRETWGAADRFYEGHDLDEPRVVAYRADRSAIQWDAEPPRKIPACDLNTWNWDSIKWKPSIFMPRWASRITLEITEMRTQRLQDISADDAKAEGFDGSVFDAVHWYSMLWDQINGPGSWKSNPWAWAISFRRAP